MVYRLAMIALLACAAGARAADSAVEALLRLPRETPIHYVDATLSLLDLGERDRAESIAAELVALDLPNEDRIALVREAGAARLLRLASEAPATAAWVDATLRVAEAANRSPDRLRRLIAELTGGDAAAARAALLAIEQTGSAGVAACLEAMRSTDNATHAARLREALVALYPEPGPSLVVALEDENPGVRTEAAYAWGRLAELDRLRSPLPAALLLAPAMLRPQEDPFGQAARWSLQQTTGAFTTPGVDRIDDAIEDLLAGTLPFNADADGTLAWPTADSSKTERLPARGVAIRIAAKLAEDAAKLRVGDASAERRALLLSLEAGRAVTDGDRLSQLPTSEVCEALRTALDRRFAAAAAGCCGLLGERRDAAALYGYRGVSPLARALDSASDSVRFAALQAISAIDPPGPFPGSSQVVETLAYFAAGEGSRQAVTAAPQLARAATAASYLAVAGYEATPVNNGYEAIEYATASPDVELILLDVDTMRPSARETLFRLRRTPGAADKPIGLLAADGRYGAAQALADEHGGAAEGVLVSARLRSPDGARAFVERLAGLRSTDSPTSEQRRERGAWAREWITRLLDEGPAFYRVRDHAPRLMAVSGGASLDALAAMGTPPSQVELAERASRGAAAIDNRRAAADAFAASVRRHGVLLTSDEILRQYDRYNASETADSETQAVLGSVLDAIEAGRDRRGAATGGEASP